MQYIFLVLFLSAFARVEAHQSIHIGAVPLDEVRIFSVVKSGLHVGFLLGTNHTAALNDVLSPEAKRVLASMKHFIHEINLKLPQPILANAARSPLGNLLDRPDVDECLPNDWKGRFDTAALKERLYLGDENWEDLHPGCLFEFWMNYLFLNCLVDSNYPGLDEYLMNLGLREGSTLHPLEDYSVRDQGSLLDEWRHNWPDWRRKPIQSCQSAFLLVAILDVFKYLESASLYQHRKVAKHLLVKNQFNNEGIVLWRTYTKDGFLRLEMCEPYFDQTLQNMDVKETLYRQRHWQKMLPKIISRIGGEPFVMACGKDHLEMRVINDKVELEELGVIHMLARLGFQVRSIKAEDIDKFTFKVMGSSLQRSMRKSRDLKLKITDNKK